MSFRRAIAVVTASAVLAVPVLVSASPVGAGPTPAAAATKAATRAQEDSVFRLYRAYFLRDPKPAEVAYWANRYSSGAALLGSISEFFARSSEFKNRYGALTNAQFVDLVYKNVLGRAADTGGRAHWIAQLDRGQSRGSVMIGFSESSEFVRATGTSSPSTGGGSSVSPWSSDQTSAMAAVNSSRQSQGKGALKAHAQAMAKAQAWAERMARTGVLEHTGGGSNVDPSGITGWCQIGENVGWGSSISSIQAEFMGSAIHRGNMLGDFTHVGVGVATKNGKIYIIQIFVKAC